MFKQFQHRDPFHAANRLLHRRMRERDAVDLETSFTHDRTMCVPARVVDLSPLGCHLRADHALVRNDRIRIIFPVVGDISGRVAWTLVGCLGVMFDDEIETLLYTRVLAAIKTGAKDWPLSGDATGAD